MTKTKDQGLLRLIAAFKLVKAVTLITVGVGALRLMHGNNSADANIQAAARFGFNPGGATLIKLSPS